VHNEQDGTTQNGTTQTSTGDSDNSDDGVLTVQQTETSPAVQSQLYEAQLFHEARGLGAGGTGATTFIIQRLTALALIPLTVWFVASVVYLSTAAHAEAAAWLAFPVNAGLMALYLVFALRHGVIGIQIVFEDYVRNTAMRAFWVLLIKAAAIVLGTAAIVALIVLALG